MLNAYYLQSYCQTEQQYSFLIALLQYRGLVQEYLHFLDSGTLPSQVYITDPSKEYLQDIYDLKVATVRQVYAGVRSYSPTA
jgi:hypothetical protein